MFEGSSLVGWPFALMAPQDPLTVWLAMDADERVGRDLENRGGPNLVAEA
jgi:hypothetical protein